MPQTRSPQRRYRINLEKVKARFWSKVDQSQECWIWTGAKWGGGRYGGVMVGDKFYLAHHVAFFLEHGRWPILNLCHSCDNGFCVRDEHLFEGSQADNVHDCISKGRFKLTECSGTIRAAAIARAKTHCVQGHPRTPENLYGRTGKSGQVHYSCISCMRERTRQWRARQHESP